MKKILVLLGGIGLAMTTILLKKEKKRKGGKKEKKRVIFGEKIGYEEVDFLDMVYVKSYYFAKYKKVIEKYPEALPIILKLNLEEESFYVFTFYDEKSGNIIEKDTKFIIPNTISQDFKDAFGDKDMIVLN